MSAFNDPCPPPPPVLILCTEPHSIVTRKTTADDSTVRQTTIALQVRAHRPATILHSQYQSQLVRSRPPGRPPQLTVTATRPNRVRRVSMSASIDTRPSEHTEGSGNDRKRVDYFYDALIGNFNYGEGHPMRPHRVRLTHDLVVRYGLFQHLNIFRPKPASKADLN